MVKPTRKKFSEADFIEEEGRQDIHHWSQRRERKYKGFRKSLHVFQIFSFNVDLIRSFFENFNFMVILQMALAGLVTYACKSLNIVYDVHVSLFISPIIFPLAFSINTDFQRREKVLEDLANFKSSAMMWLFCMRDWREACCFDDNFMKAVGNKIKAILFHLREYLLTDKIERRRFIARVIYEDLSDANQLIEKVRGSKLNANSPLVSRIVHLLNMMCLSYERLRVIREYRSPRSIRSFTKVLIFVLPMLLSPYYVHLGNKVQNTWSPYYIAIMVAFVFGALQGVQDKLDDPFDGMSEDDIKLDTLDEWTVQSLEATAHRTYKIGRFQVSANPTEAVTDPSGTSFGEVVDGNGKRKRSVIHKDKERPSFKDRFVPHRHHHVAKSPVRTTPRSIYSEDESKSDEFELHPYAGVLNNIKGNTTILRGGHIKKRDKSYDDLNSLNGTLTKETGKAIAFNQVIFGENNSQLSIRSSTNTPVSNIVPDTIQSLFNINHPDEVSITVRETPLTSANISANLEQRKGGISISGVASYLAMQKKLKRSNSRGSISNGSVSSDNMYCKPAFVIGNSMHGGSINSIKDGPKSRFNVFSTSNSSSTKPLLQSTLSIDSDTITSSDEESRVRPKSAQEQRGNFNYNCLTGASYSVSPVQSAQSEGSIIHALKEEEIFI